MITRTLALVALLAVTLTAQDMPGPPEELAKFDAILGHWKGAGNVILQEGMDKMKWTSRNHARKVMGGHFIRDDVRIEIEGLPGALCFINFITYDAHLGKFLQYSVGTTGELSVNEIMWVSDDVYITSTAMVREGKPQIERWTTQISKEKVAMVGHNSTIGKWWVHVEGDSKRDPAGKPVNIEGPAFMNMPAPSEMKKLKGMAGHYEMNGEWAMAPDQEFMKFKGTEHVKPMWGGHVHLTLSGGDNDYQGFGALVWDAGNKCYRRFHLSSMGGFHGTTRANWADDKTLSFAQVDRFMGQMMIGRTNITLDDSGRLVSTKAYAMLPKGKPFNSFNATYKLKAVKLGGGN